jgi:hypothetical protein
MQCSAQTPRRSTVCEVHAIFEVEAQHTHPDEALKRREKRAVERTLQDPV